MANSSSLAIMPYEPRERDFPWVDCNTVKNIQCIVTNVFFQRYHVPLEFTGLGNLPCRVWNCIDSFRYGDLWRAALDIASFVAVFFPGGRGLSIVIDCTSEAINIYNKLYNNSWQKRRTYHPIDQELLDRLNDPNTPWARLDCTKPEDARKRLQLTEEEAKNMETVKKHYKYLWSEWEYRVNALAPSHPIRNKLIIIRDQTETAYQTLSEESYKKGM